MNNSYKPCIEDITAISGIDTLPPGKLDITMRMGQLSKMDKGKKVLVTCSHRGYQCILYSKKFGVEVTGIEYDSEMIDFARLKSDEENISINFIKADAIKLPFGEGHFDIVTNEGAVGISGHPQELLAEGLRVVNKNGIYVFRESILADELSEEEKEELCSRYGNDIETVNGWVKRINEAGGEVEYIETEPWSEPSNFWNVRHDREVADYHDLYTMAEKLKLSKILLKKYGQAGIAMAADNERIFYEAVKVHKIGYGIFICRKR